MGYVCVCALMLNKRTDVISSDVESEVGVVRVLGRTRR
jgi:hypothetical protein